eukprot:gene13420-15812_t
MEKVVLGEVFRENPELANQTAIFEQLGVAKEFSWFEAGKYLVLIIIVQIPFTFVRYTLFTIAGFNLTNALKRDLFRSLLTQEVDYFEPSKTGELNATISSDTLIIQNIVTVSLSTLFRCMLQSGGSLLILVFLSWRITLFVASFFILFIICYAVFSTTILPRYKYMQELHARASNIVDNSVTNISEIRSLNGESKELRSFETELETIYRASKASVFTSGFWISIGGLAVMLLVVATFMYMLSQTITNGVKLFQYVLYALMMSISTSGLVGVLSEFQKMAPSLKRVFSLIDRRPRIPFQGGLIPSSDANISFENVSCHHHKTGQVLLSGVSFELPRNKTVALVGPSPSKDALFPLVQGIQQPTRGSVYVGRIDTKALDVHHFRNKICTITANTVIFEGTVEQKASKKADLHDFIISLPHGYDTMLGKGERLGVAHMQKVSMARAFLRDPAVLLVDEASSSRLLSYSSRPTLVRAAADKEKVMDSDTESLDFSDSSVSSYGESNAPDAAQKFSRNQQTFIQQQLKNTTTPSTAAATAIATTPAPTTQITHPLPLPLPHQAPTPTPPPQNNNSQRGGYSSGYNKNSGSTPLSLPVSQNASFATGSRSHVTHRRDIHPRDGRDTHREHEGSDSEKPKLKLRNAAFGMLSKERINLLLTILREKNIISSIDNKISIVLSIEEILALMLDELSKRDIRLINYGIRLVGSTASKIVGSAHDKSDAFNDIDLSFYIMSRTNFMSLLDVEETIIAREVYRQTGNIVTKKEVFDTFFRERVKVTGKRDDPNGGDDWSLISIGHENARNIDIKFVKRIQRPYAFSIDSFQIILDPIIENYTSLLPPANDLFTDHTFLSAPYNKDEPSRLSIVPVSTTTPSTSTPTTPTTTDTPTPATTVTSPPTSPSFYFEGTDAVGPVVSPPTSSSSSSVASSVTSSLILSSVTNAGGPSSTSSTSSSSNSSPLSFSNSSLPTIFTFSPNLLNGEIDEGFPPLVLNQVVSSSEVPVVPSSAPAPTSVSVPVQVNNITPATTVSTTTPTPSSTTSSTTPTSTTPSTTTPTSTSRRGSIVKTKSKEEFPPLGGTVAPKPSTPALLPNNNNNTTTNTNTNNNISTPTTPTSLWSQAKFVDKFQPPASNKPRRQPKPRTPTAVATASAPVITTDDSATESSGGSGTDDGKRRLKIQVFCIYGNYFKARLDLDANTLITNEPRQIRRGIFRYCHELSKGRVSDESQMFNEIFRETFFTQDKMKPADFEKTLVKYIKKHRTEASSFLKHLESILIQPYKPTPPASPLLSLPKITLPTLPSTTLPPSTTSAPTLLLEPINEESTTNTTSTTTIELPVIEQQQQQQQEPTSESTTSTPASSTPSSPSSSTTTSIANTTDIANDPLLDTIETSFDIYYFDYLNIISFLKSFVSNDNFDTYYEKKVFM